MASLSHLGLLWVSGECVSRDIVECVFLAQWRVQSAGNPGDLGSNPKFSILKVVKGRLITCPGGLLSRLLRFGRRVYSYPLSSQARPTQSRSKRPNSLTKYASVVIVVNTSG